MLHAAQREMILLQKAVVREDGQNVRKGVADTKDGFHIRHRLLTKIVIFSVSLHAHG
jgi:hypothetical protein